MKLRITHISNTYNYGSAMMAISLICGLKTLMPGYNLQFYVDARTEGDLERLKRSTNVEDIFIYHDEMDYKWSQYNSINKALHLMHKLEKIKQMLDSIVRDFDAVIILGGDDFSEYYDIKHVVLEMIKLKYLSRRIPVFLAGQTIGPFSSYRVGVARWALSETIVYARDHNCFEYVRSVLNHDKTINSSDLAFLELPYQYDRDHIDKIKAKYGLTHSKYFTLVPSGLTHLYTNDYDNYVNAWVEIVRNMLKIDGWTGKVVLLPHVFSPKGPEDLMVINRIVSLIQEKELLERIVVIQDVMYPHEARIILGNGVLTVTGRMHAAISSYQMNRPAICLANGVKYAGVIGGNLHMENLVIECSDENIWASGDIVKVVMDKVLYLKTNYDSIVERVILEVDATVKLAFRQLEDIAIRLKGL